MKELYLLVAVILFLSFIITMTLSPPTNDYSENDLCTDTPTPTATHTDIDADSETETSPSDEWNALSYSEKYKTVENTKKSFAKEFNNQSVDWFINNLDSYYSDENSKMGNITIIKNDIQSEINSLAVSNR